MKTFLPLIFSLIFVCHAVAGEPDTIKTAPSGQYSITQHDVSTSDCGACFDTVLHFHDKSKPDVNLTLGGGKLDDVAYHLKTAKIVVTKEKGEN